MTKGIFIVLLLIAIIGGSLLYYMQQGPAILMKSPEEQKIAYISDADGNHDIWLMNANGSGKVNITNDKADDQMPVWSPDGKEIMAISDKTGNTYQIYASSWTGRYKVRRTNSAGSKDSIVWRHDGEEIGYIANGKVYTLGRHGGEEEQFLPAHDSPDLAEMSGTSNPFIYASWSSDNKEIFYIRQADAGNEISVINASPESQTKPLTIIAAQNVDAAWSVAGSKIAIAFIDQDGNNGILVYDNDTLDVRKLIMTKGDTIGFAKPVWTPDSSVIVFEEWSILDGIHEKCLGIYGINASGGKPFLIAAGDARQPKISPDGKTVIYTLPYDGKKRNIWSRSIDGKGSPVNLTDSKGDNFDPAWSPAPIKK